MIVFLAVGLIWGIALNYVSFKNTKDKKMTITKLTPNLMVKDVNKTIEFYENMLDFKVVISVPDTGNFDFAILSKDGIELMIQKRESFISELPHMCDSVIGGTFALYIDVEDIDEIYNKVKGTCKILSDMHDTFYGTKEFSCKDINGYVLTFSESVE